MESSTLFNAHYCKLQLQCVISNLEKLEQAQQNKLNLESQGVADLLNETTDILANLEQQPTHKLKTILQKRQRKRRRAKLKRKQQKIRKDESSKVKVNLTKENSQTQVLPKTISTQTTTSPKPAQKPHQQLRSYRDANRFLKTFELLELLHTARSEDEEATREFANKLSRLRSIWNVIRFENKPDFSATKNVEHQWNCVLFGETEKSFFQQKRSVVDLINVRRKWDSFITNDAKIGTTIPAGWVLPPENPDECWQRYQIQ